MNELTRFLLQIIGPSLVIVGISIAASHKNYLRMIKDMDKQPMTIFISGLITFISGLAILINHNLYNSAAEIIVTTFGWILMIKGVAIIIIPRSSIAFGHSITGWLKVTTLIWMTLGTYIWWLGFFS